MTSEEHTAHTHHDTEAVLKVRWGSGVTAFLRFTDDGAVLATKSTVHGWKTRTVDGSGYLADVRQVEPDTTEIPLSESPWGKHGGINAG